MSKYPIVVEQSIYQYDEHVFVWFDETGGVGGASNYLDEARAELKSYASYLDGNINFNSKKRQASFNNDSNKTMLETVETLYE